MAKFFNLIRVPYSGAAIEYGEADLRDSMDIDQSVYLGECKSMTPRSKTEVNFILKESWLVGPKGITTRAKRVGNKIPFLTFTKVRSSKSFVVITPEDFRMFMNILKKSKQIGILPDVTDVEMIRLITDAWYPNEEELPCLEEELDQSPQ